MYEIKTKILVVDDEPTNLKIFSRVLSGKFDLEMAKNGKEAMQKLASFHPNIIILDVMLPDINGYEICKRIRETPNLAETKIIMVSAKAIVSERIEGYASGADDYVSKPFDPREFLAKICVFSNMIRYPNQ